MSKVKYATICDMPGCGVRSFEYETFPSCEECQRDLCPAHQFPGSLDLERLSAICHDCAREVRRG